MTAGTGATVTGAGTPGNPYVVSATGVVVTAVDTATIDHSLTGTGTPGDPYVLSSSVKLDPAVGNLLTITPGAGLRLDCDDLAACGPFVTDVLDTPTVNLTNAAGIISADVIPDPARGLSNGPAGVGICLSVDVGNTAVFGTDGCLFVPAGGAAVPFTVTDSTTVNLTVTPAAPQDLTAAVIIDPNPNNLIEDQGAGLLATLITGCGLTGNGVNGGDPLTVNVQTNPWPYACDEATEGGPIYCGADNVLRTAPLVDVFATLFTLNTNLPDTPVPAALTTIETTNAPATNPSECAQAFRVTEVEVDVDFNMPPNSSAEVAIAGDVMHRVLNTTDTAWVDYHVQVTKVFPVVDAANATTLGQLDIQVRGAGGSTYNRVQWFVRHGYITSQIP